MRISRASSTALLVAAGAFAALLGGCPPAPTGGPDAGPSARASASASAAAAPQLPDPSPWKDDERTAAIAAGKAVIVKHECTRCHTVDDVPPAGRSFHCTSCHEWLKGLAPGNDQYEKLAKKWGADIIGRYQKNIVHLQKVPDLTTIATRVRPDWLAKYLAEPWDLRPSIGESMIRHQLSEADVKAVVRYFAAVARAPDPYAPGFQAPAPGPRPSDTRIAEGKQLFLERACTGCHTFGNLDTKVTAETLKGAGPGAGLAINLRFVRDRTRPDALVDWLLDPKVFEPKTLMPAVGLDRAAAEKIRDFLFWGDPALEPTPPEVEPPEPKILPREVTYEEMKERTLGKVCVHCHMNDYEKDTGPGNHGGMGYPARGLRMRTYETLVEGAHGADGKRYSVLVPRKGEKLAPILQVMLDRRKEERRDHVPAFHDYERPPYPKLAVPGMPLGLPSMTDEELSILATWISRGCKGPKAQSGREGVDDGFLVPDGPLAKNQGCELRMAEKKRPAWAVDQKEPGKIEKKDEKDHKDHKDKDAKEPKAPAKPEKK